MKIVNGILQGAKFIQSPNHGGRINPRFVVWHYTAGWNAASAISTLTNPSSKVSAQFVIDRDGTITQLVSCEQRAWHGGPSAFMGFKDMNTHAIGIELVNPGYILPDGQGGFLSPGPKPRPVPAANLQGYRNGMLLQAHPRIGGKPVVWLPYTEAQLEASRQLLAAICEPYDIIASCSHEEIDQRGWKTDPGPLFPIGEFKALTDKFEGRGSSAPRPGAVPIAVVNAASLNARETPGGAIKGGLQRGDTVVIVEDRGEWVKVTAKGLPSALWVADKFLDHGRS